MAVPSALTPPSDASYLRRLLERQPACLIRVRLDGVLLACNDAALSLFGVRALRAVLNTNLTDRIIPAERTRWQEFAMRCWANGAASLECNLVLSDDDARPVLVQGVALKDHPDGVESLLLHLRDQSQTHRLEHSIQSAESDRVGNEARQRAARDQAEAATAERLKLAVLADEGEAERRRLTQALEAQTVERQRRQAIFVELEKKVEESQLVLLEKEREHRAGVAALKTALAAAHAAQIPAVAGDDYDKQVLEAITLRLQAATAEQARLEALVAEYEVDRKRIAADHHAVVDTLEQSLARAGDEAVLGHEQSRHALAELRAQLVQVLGEQGRMAARAEEHEREQDLMRAEHNRALADLETSNGLALAELRSQLAQASAEQGRLAARVEEHELARERLIAEHHQALGDVETSKREALAELRSQLEQSSVEGPERERELIRAEHDRALADLETGKRVVAELGWQLSQASLEQSRLAAQVEEHERERDSAIAERHRDLAETEISRREALAELRSQLAEAFANQRRLVARVEEHELERDSVMAEHHRALAEMETGKREALAELRSQLSQAFTDERRLAARIQEHELERDSVIAEHHRALAEMGTGKSEALAELRSQLSQAFADGRRLAARVDDQELERDRLRAEHYRALADLENAKRDALAELRSQLSQAVAEHSRLTARLEEHDSERERMGAEHRRAITDLQVSKREAVFECERVLTEVQHSLLVRDGARLLEIERRLIDEIDEGARKKAHGERSASLVQAELAQAFSNVQAVLENKEVLTAPFEAEHNELERPTVETIDRAAAEVADYKRLSDEQVGLGRAVSETRTVSTDVDPLHDLFDDADDAFVRHLLEGTREPPLPQSLEDPTAGLAQAVSEMRTVTTRDDPEPDLFDAQDDTFVRSLMEAPPEPARESAGPTDAQPRQELPEKEPSPPEDS